MVWTVCGTEPILSLHAVFTALMHTNASFQLLSWIQWYPGFLRLHNPLPLVGHIFPNLHCDPSGYDLVILAVASGQAVSSWLLDFLVYPRPTSPLPPSLSSHTLV